MQVGAIAICAHCGATCVRDGDTARLSRFADLDGMSPEDMHTLVRARSAIVRPGRPNLGRLS